MPEMYNQSPARPEAGSQSRIAGRTKRIPFSYQSGACQPDTLTFTEKCNEVHTNGHILLEWHTDKERRWHYFLCIGYRNQEFPPISRNRIRTVCQSGYFRARHRSGTAHRVYLRRKDGWKPGARPRLHQRLPLPIDFAAKRLRKYNSLFFPRRPMQCSKLNHIFAAV